MVFFNYATMQMAAKIVYYGPGLCGKTTNLQYIYQKTAPKSRGEMVSLETETDRTLFFDLLPIDVGNIAGFKTRFQLYTVPGQVFYNSTRKLVLRGVDGIVFVADSQIPMLDANLESIGNLRTNLGELGLNLDDVPLVLQYNKRDLANVASVEDLNRHLNPKNLPYFEASALQGAGVFETLKGISKATLITLRKRALGEDRMRTPDVLTRPMAGRQQEPPRPASVTPTPPRTPATPPGASTNVAPRSIFLSPNTPAPEQQPVQPQSAAPAQDAQQQYAYRNEAEQQQPTPEHAAAPSEQQPQASQEPEAVQPTAAEIATEKVEFAEVSGVIAKPAMKKIAVKTSDIASKLDSLRDIYTAKPSYTKEKKGESLPDPLMALLDRSRDEKKSVNKKLKIKLDSIELDAVKNLALDFHLTGDNNLHKRFSNAVNVTVEGKGNPRRVVLRIELEIEKK